MPALIPFYLDPKRNPDGAEPVPYSALMNEQLNPTYYVLPGKTYLFRIVNMAAFSSAFLRFDQHTMTIVEADGIYTEPTVVTDLYVATAQRYSVLVTMKSGASQNFAVLASMDTDMYDEVPGYLWQNVTGTLVYDDTKEIIVQTPIVEKFNPIDDFDLIPSDHEPLLKGKPDTTIVLDLDFWLRDGENRYDKASFVQDSALTICSAGFNNITYITQRVPSLYTVLSTGTDAENPVVYGVNANPFIVHENDLVEIVVNNYDDGAHPIHVSSLPILSIDCFLTTPKASRPRHVSCCTRTWSLSSQVLQQSPS
jgi:iron transport multicopper oxidase